MFRRKPEQIIPDPEAMVLLREAVDLLEEAFGRYGDWRAPTSWVERKKAFVVKYREAQEVARG